VRLSYGLVVYIMCYLSDYCQGDVHVRMYVGVLY